MNKELVEVAKHFKVDGNIVYCEPYGNGHINKTYLLKTDKVDYIMQQINSLAFKDVDLLMNNIKMVTEYLRSKNIESMEIVNTNDDKLYYKAGENAYFRIYKFVMNTVCYEEVTNDDLLVKDGVAFGQFHNLLSGLDATKLGEVIPNFHNTPNRYKLFEIQLEKDSKNRKKTCLPEIESILKFKDKLSLITDGLKDGSINYAITHNDPKINNILFDAKSNEVRCVIDLDTIMPGSILYDIGDTFRSLFVRCYEDSKDLSLIKVDYNVFRNYMIGYLSQMKGKLTKKEIELIPYSAFLMTIECGIRFLTDYLEGDVYFHTTYPEHNLVRCRTQIKLSEDIYNHFDELNKIVAEILEK